MATSEPFVVDIDLHQSRSSRHPTVLSWQTVVSKCELENLYEINQKLNIQNEAYKSELEELNKLKEENKSLKEKLLQERQKNVIRDQADALHKCQFDSLMRDVENATRNYVSDRQDVQRGEITGKVSQMGRDMSEMLQKLAQLEREVADWSQNGHSTQSPTKRKEELEQRLEQRESLLEMVTQEKKSLEGKVQNLERKLAILTPPDDEEEKINEITIKKCGRFEIHKRELECARCKEAFSSKSEMEASPCVFHPMTPVRPKTDSNDKGSEFYWRCCATTSCRKKSMGCEKGRHILSNKRARIED